MKTPDLPPRRGRVFSKARRVLTILAIWITATTIGAVGYQAGSSRSGLEIVFAVEFAITMAVSASLALAIGGRRRTALEVFFATTGPIVLYMAVAFPMFRYMTIPAWRRLGVRYEAGIVLILFVFVGDAGGWSG